jgi:CubicO group peptidase (beta-lactamase class C family)
MKVLGAVAAILTSTSATLQGVAEPQAVPKPIYNDVTSPAWRFTSPNFPRDERDTTSGLVSNETANHIGQLIEEWNSTGIAVAVVQRDETVTDPEHPGWRIEYGSYGFATKNSTASTAVTPDTLFAIASNSKLFLALSVGLIIHNMTLADDFRVQHGVELGWSTRMRDLLGEDWEMWDEDATKGATIADLLTHRTGLPRHDFMRVSREGGIREQVCKISLMFEPGI